MDPFWNEPVPSAGVIERLAAEVAETAARIRGEVELRYEREGSSLAGSYLPSGSSAGTLLARGEDGRILGTPSDWAALRSQYDWVRQLLVTGVGPDPAGFTPLADAMRQAGQRLYDRVSHVEIVDTYLRQAESILGNWTGTAADSFKTNFLLRIGGVAKNHAALAEMLQHAMVANRDIWAAQRRDLRAASQNALFALESVTRCGGGQEAKFWLSVVSAVATVVSVAPTLGMSIPLGVAGWTIIAGASSGLAVAAEAFERPIETDLSADTVDGVLTKLADAVTRIQRGATDRELDIVDALRRNLSLISAQVESFVIAQPGVVDGSHKPDVVRNFKPG